MRPFDRESDAGLVYEVSQEALGDEPGHVRDPYDEWLHYAFREPFEAERTHIDAGGRRAPRGPCHPGQGLLRLEPERRVERQRSGVVRLLDEPHADGAAGPLERRAHQPASDPLPLERRLHGDRGHARDRIALVQEDDPGHAAGALGDEAVDRREAEEVLGDATGDLEARKARGKPVLRRDPHEGLVEDARARLGIGAGDAPMQDQRLHDLCAHSHVRRERGQRVLEDHGDGAAAQGVEPFGAGAQDFLAAIADAAGGAPI